MRDLIVYLLVVLVGAIPGFLLGGVAATGAELDEQGTGVCQMAGAAVGAGLAVMLAFRRGRSRVDNQ